MPVMLGGEKARGYQTYGDIVVFRQYVNGEPALVMVPKRRRMLGSVGAYIVCLSAAWQYDDERYLMHQAMIAAEHMGMGTERSIVVRIAQAINNELPELVMMKPEPEDKPMVIGEGTLESGDGQKFNFELTDDMLRDNG